MYYFANLQYYLFFSIQLSATIFIILNMLIKSISPIHQDNNEWHLENYVITNSKNKVNAGSQIFEGVNKCTNESVAIKCLKCKDINMKEFETIIMANPVSYPFILNLHSVLLCQQNETLYLVFDKCLGSLNDYVANITPNQLPYQLARKLSENEALKIFFQIIEACFWLWGNDINHCNIKPECIFYRYDQSLKKNIFVISDFGVSTFKSCFVISGSDVSPYMSPEAARNNACNYFSDVWSLGLILHKLIFGESYYDEVDDNSIKNKILSKEYNLTTSNRENISAKTASLLESMIKHDIKQRVAKEELQKIIRGFYEYDFVREVMIRFRYKKLFFESNQNATIAYLQYAKKLINNSWEMGLNGYYEASKNMTEEAMIIYLNVLGEDCPEARYAMIRYAQNLMFLDQIEDAKIVGDKALGLYEKNNNKNDPDLAKAYMIMGSIYYKFDEHKTSIELLEKAIKMRLDINGDHHRETASAINNLGATLRHAGNLIGAKENWKKSLNIKIKLFGSQHFEASFSFYNLSLVFFDLKNYKKSLKFCRKAKKIREKHFGLNHQKVKEINKHEYMILQAIKTKYV